MNALQKIIAIIVLPVTIYAPMYGSEQEDHQDAFRGNILAVAKEQVADLPPNAGLDDIPGLITRTNPPTTAPINVDALMAINTTIDFINLDLLPVGIIPTDIKTVLASINSPQRPPR